MNIEERKSLRYTRKAGIAILFAMFFFFLGIFAGPGYHLYEIKEIGTPLYHTDLGYAEVKFRINIMFNPVLYPFYWMMGSGHLNGDFSAILVPEAYQPGEFGGPIWGLPSDRLKDYVVRTVVSGALPNLIVLLIWTFTIEIVEIRSLYLVLLGGVLGFYVWEVVGAFLGLAIGCVVIYLFLGVWRNNPILKLWNSLWERQEPAHVELEE